MKTISINFVLYSLTYVSNIFQTLPHIFEIFESDGMLQFAIKHLKTIHQTHTHVHQNAEPQGTRA